ncbi:UvrD-helicase domain-containing protein [Paludisphaera rhizosphaerae]|uniref:UvrD-helicase domain-containing protein n=1 Tax=Paludisphaera rhizosphaerae TaxID=2711216 RepID=UPI0013EA01FD|nr:UvrD-helicase domain-containing protein [Paludisphaera rhizosphaerae]
MSGHVGDDQVRLTSEQRGPLIERRSSVALAAGAGCGKTTVLTERFLGEIDGLEGRALRSLAVMTFTEKAARELRQRIRGRCRAKLAAGADPAWWTTVLRALEAAPIGTFHEFCGRVLRTRAGAVGVDPEFVVLDDVVAGALRAQAVAATIRRLIADRDADMLLLSVSHGLRAIREMLEDALARRTPDEVDPLGDLEPPQIVARWQDVWTKRARPATLARLDPLFRACRRTLEPLVGVSPKLTALRGEVLDALDAVESDSCRDDDLDRLREAAKVAGLRGKNDWPDDDVKARVGKVFEDLRGKIRDLGKKLSWDEDVTLAAAEETAQFARLVKAAREEYDRLKRRRRGLDFSDLIVLTREALRATLAQEDADEPEVEPTAIDLVLVDEFQDTDEVQSDVLRLLAREGFREGRMFVVGDAKQSIYRFRGAEPAVFGRWREEFPEPGRLRLSENFRTVPKLIHFVNALFADSFSTGSEPDPASVRLSPVRPDHADDPGVHFFWVEPPAAADGEPAPKPSARECRVREADALARWLRAELDAGWTVIDRKAREPRNAHAGDVAILLRAMTDVWPYETALADQGFEYHTIGGSAFYAQQEILDVVNLLSVVEDPLDETALAGCLRSPFFALSDEGLFWLSRGGGLSRGLERAADVPGLSNRDREQARRARRLLAGWRALKDHVPMAELLSRMLDESGFTAAIVCEFLGARKLANVRKLVETAREFDRRGGFGLADFVGRLRAFADDPPREEQASTTEEDGESVRIMTVHQAKGLEFPIVFLPDLNRDAGVRTGSMGFDRDLGLVLRPQVLATELENLDGNGESLGWLAYRAIEEREEREEALRLFYVAATRARDDLILSSGFDKPLAEVAASVSKLSPALNLLWERFDGRTGRRTAVIPEDWPDPEVAVVDVAAIGATEERSRPEWVKLPEIVGAILDAPRETPVEASPPAAPRFVDLEAPRLSDTRSSRLGEIIRAAAVDAELLAGADPQKVVARLAARRTPAAGKSLQAEAVAWLRTWVDSSFFTRLRAAVQSPADVRPSEAWVLQGATTVRGSTDALIRGGEDRRWRPLTFLAPGEPEAWGRLRASLAAAALEAKNVGPLGPSWLLIVTTGGELKAERCNPITDAERDRLLREMAAV